MTLQRRVVPVCGSNVSVWLKEYEVEDTWEGDNGALFVLVSVPRESLQCRTRRGRLSPQVNAQVVEILGNIGNRFGWRSRRPNLLVQITCTGSQ
jgi:hypothetical protein